MEGETPFPRQLLSPSVTFELLPSSPLRQTAAKTTATMAMPTQKETLLLCMITIIKFTIHYLVS